jgi:sarcosine oxidase subunit gamma
VPELIAKSPLAGQAPVTHGRLTLAEVVLDRVTSVAPFKGDKTLAKGLKALGVSFPAPNASTGSGAVRMVWTGMDQAFLIGADPAGLSGAALTDQSDGWACLRLSGEGADQALMRLVPLDLRLAAFGVGRVARAPLNHMAMILIRTAPDAFEILVFRSMARSAWHEVVEAMQIVAARAAVAG